ncbi:hypothetical protein BaOVIS_026240 [Babesia ovis]|uniref:Uncharacterized protein n=1 Tax=Babesia ovis TaxID=5869 RepID=A0A9W5TCY2_BABOV|nr:hypothetical protein BaOVIS_026240 [Babesia ovis]
MMLMCNYLSRFAAAQRRFYRIYPGRRRLQVETKIKSPKRYDELRGGNPTALLQGNLFTPESAGPRELAMLCFRIVGMGYADTHVLLRYASCTLQQLKHLRIKHIALILQAISKFLATNPSVLGKSDCSDTASFQEDIANREKLLLKVGEIAEAAEPQMPKLFARALPKDLGMIALSMVTVCECAYRELDVQQHSRLLAISERTMKLVADAMGPKLLFCEAHEYAALARAYSKLPPNHEFVELFLRDLADEVSSLLVEKQEQLEELVRGNFIGEDLLESIMALPKDMTTIACALSRRVHHHRIWDTMTECLKLILKLDINEDGSFGGLDGQTLMLLATSLSRHVNIGFLLEAMISRPEDPRKTTWIVTGISLALRCMDDLELAQRMWDTLDFEKVLSLDDSVKTQLVHASIRIPHVNTSQMETIRSLSNGAASPELLVALYAARERCGLETSAKLLDTIMANIDDVSVSSLIILLRSVGSGNASTPTEREEKYRVECSMEISGLNANIKDMLINALSDRVGDVHLEKLYPLLIYTIDNHGGRTDLIAKMASRIANAAGSYQDHHLAILVEKLRQIGINPDNIFGNAVMGRLQSATTADEHPVIDHFVNAHEPVDIADIKFCDTDDAEVSKLAMAHNSHEGLAPCSRVNMVG